MFKEVNAKEAVNALLDGNESVFVITHLDGNTKIARLNEFSVNILVDPQIKDGYRYIVDDGTIVSTTKSDILPTSKVTVPSSGTYDSILYDPNPMTTKGVWT